jgi:hypothetical protein
MSSSPWIPLNPSQAILLPTAAGFVGFSVGLYRGAQKAGLQHLAENAHCPPRTVRGWYEYKRAKYNRTILAGMKKGGRHALALSSVAVLWVGAEEGAAYVGLAGMREIAAGLATATAVAATCTSVHPSPLFLIALSRFVPPPGSCASLLLVPSFWLRSTRTACSTIAFCYTQDLITLCFLSIQIVCRSDRCFCSDSRLDSARCFCVLHKQAQGRCWHPSIPNSITQRLNKPFKATVVLYVDLR